MSGFSANTTRTLAVAASIIMIAGCSPTFKYHGYAPSEDQLANVIVGADTRETVEEIIGRPSSSGVLEDGSWYYVSSKVRHYTYKNPKTIERELVAVSFDDSGVVANVERFGLEDGRVVTLSRRVTDLPVKGPTALAQILGNIGNIDLGDQFGDG
jgi:outer membrane protein assembly factor BamE (lipoprotein component of BamABCDE complex)